MGNKFESEIISGPIIEDEITNGVCERIVDDLNKEWEEGANPFKLDDDGFCKTIMFNDVVLTRDDLSIIDRVFSNYYNLGIDYFIEKEDNGFGFVTFNPFNKNDN